MSLWRLELLRLLRTHRWMILFGVYVSFGVLGPLSARYAGELVERFGGGVSIEFPDPRPVDGIIQFVSNASQLGLLAVVIVAAGSIALDARPELAAFLRTRVERPRRLLWPRYVVVAAASAAALVAGTAVAWVTTAALIGSPPAGPVAVGTLYGGAYLAFAVAALAAVAGFVRSAVGAVFGTLVVLLLLPALGLLPVLQAWLPSALLGAVVAMVEGAPASEYLRALGATAVVTAGLLALAAWRLEQREL